MVHYAQNGTLSLSITPQLGPWSSGQFCVITSHDTVCGLSNEGLENWEISQELEIELLSNILILRLVTNQIGI